MYVDDPSGTLSCYLRYAMYRQGNIEAHYYVPKTLGFVGSTTNANDAYIIITDQNGSQIANEKCLVGSGIVTIPVATGGPTKIYTVTMVNKGNVIATTKLHVK